MIEEGLGRCQASASGQRVDDGLGAAVRGVAAVDGEPGAGDAGSGRQQEDFRGSFVGPTDLLTSGTHHRGGLTEIWGRASERVPRSSPATPSPARSRRSWRAAAGSGLSAL
jgi:hypothetical protein